MSTRDKRTRQEYALLMCGEYFRDYLEMCGGISEDRMKKLEGLRDLCFDALGDPSVKDANDIRSRHAQLPSAGRGGINDTQ